MMPARQPRRGKNLSLKMLAAAAAAAPTGVATT